MIKLKPMKFLNLTPILWTNQLDETIAFLPKHLDLPVKKRVMTGAG